jgi:8-oxo-dGTP pyrophosphatase MutT (NUDIX family)
MGNITAAARRLERDLQSVARRFRRQKYFWPTERAMQTIHGIVSHWAPELVITRRHRDRVEILLARYNGGVREFRGLWHLPGGYNKIPDARRHLPQYSFRFGIKSIQPTISRIALREIGVDAEVEDIMDLYWWPRWLRNRKLFRNGRHHPYGWPLSIYLRCQPDGEIRETEDLRWFPVGQLPQNTVIPHREFIRENIMY